MEKLHGLITAPLHEVEVERIAAVNSIVEVTSPKKLLPPESCYRYSEKYKTGIC